MVTEKKSQQPLDFSNVFGSSKWYQTSIAATTGKSNGFSADEGCRKAVFVYLCASFNQKEQ